jgi:hypothetical protein
MAIFTVESPRRIATISLVTMTQCAVGLFVYLSSSRGEERSAGSLSRRKIQGISKSGRLPEARGQSSSDHYLAFGTATPGFEKIVSSSLGFTTTFSTMIFSTGMTDCLAPFAATGRTFVSMRNGT